MEKMNQVKIIILLSYICIASLSAAIITPALPQIESFYHLSHGSLEWVVSLFLLGYVIGQLIYGPLANRYSPLNALRLGLMVNLVGIVLCIVATVMPNYGLLLFGRFITALGSASGLACTFMLIQTLLNEEQAKHALAFTIVSFTLGIGLAVTIGGMLTQYVSWQACFYALVLHGVLMLALTWIFPMRQHQPKKISIKNLCADYTVALKSRTLVTYSLIIGLSSAFGYGYSAAAPLISVNLFHLTPSQYGYWNLMNMVGMCASGFLTKHLMTKYEPKQIIIGAISACGLSLFSLMIQAYFSGGNVLWFFLNTTWLYLFTGMLFPCASFYASKAIECKASASSMMSFINMSSATLAVIIMGYLPFSPLVSFIVILVIFAAIALSGLKAVYGLT